MKKIGARNCYTIADLHRAIVCEDLLGVQNVVNLGNVTPDACWKGMSALQCAVKRNLPEIVKFLVSAGANVNCRTPKNQNDLIHADETPLLTAIRLNHIEIVRILLNSPEINVNERSLFCRYTPLWLAVFNSHSSELVEMLLDSGADINIHKSFVKCPLRMALCGRRAVNRKVGHLLIRRGYDICCKKEPNFLLCCKQNADRETFELLIRAGCPVSKEMWLLPSYLPLSWQSDSAFCDWIQQLQCNPRSLQDLAIFAIRRHLTSLWKNLHYSLFEKLGLPPSIKKLLVI